MSSFDNVLGEHCMSRFRERGQRPLFACYFLSFIGLCLQPRSVALKFIIFVACLVFFHCA